MVKFEPVYSTKKTAEERKDWYNGEKVIKVKGDFKFRRNGKNITRKTGYKIVGGKL